MLLYNLQVVFWVEHPVQMRLCPIFVKLCSGKGEHKVWYVVNQHPQVFRGLTIGKRTPEFWCIIAWYQSLGL